MRARSDSIDEFLVRSGWQGARRAPLAGDASFRRYERVHADGKAAVLMDAPPGKEDIRPFIHIGEHLVRLGLSAPRIYAADAENGFLLLEDLGDDLFARVLAARPAMEGELYRAAADALATLYHKAGEASALDIPLYDTPRFLSQVALLPQWFLPLFVPQRQRLQEMEAEYLAIWREALTQLPDMSRVPVLYDFHAENILWLPDRAGVARAGLLDFQDAVWGLPAYDMVSLLEDARRDVAPEVAAQVVEHYLERTGLPEDAFMTAYALLGAQRNCRIVGTFARLALRDGKRHYLSYLPRVWRHLENDWRHPLLGALKNWMDKAVPKQWRGVIDPGIIQAQAAG